MSAIAPQNKPFAGADAAATNEIPGHVARGLNHPERSISEIIKGLFKRSELLPRTSIFGEFFGGLFGVEKVAVPSGFGIREIARRAILDCARAKVAVGVGKHL
jgi:hypothetical protein